MIEKFEDWHIAPPEKEHPEHIPDYIISILGWDARKSFEMGKKRGRELACGEDYKIDKEYQEKILPLFRYLAGFLDDGTNQYRIYPHRTSDLAKRSMLFTYQMLQRIFWRGFYKTCRGLALRVEEPWQKLLEEEENHLM